MPFFPTDPFFRNHLHLHYTCSALLHRTYRSPSDTVRLVSWRALERPLNHRSTTRTRGDMSTCCMRESPTDDFFVGSDDAPRSSLHRHRPPRAHTYSAYQARPSDAGPMARTTADSQDAHASTGLAAYLRLVNLFVFIAWNLPRGTVLLCAFLCERMQDWAHNASWGGAHCHSNQKCVLLIHSPVLENSIARGA